MENLNTCPVCGQKAFDIHIVCKDYTVSGEIFTIQKCNKCGFTFTNPRPPENVIGRYYQSENYISHSNTNEGIIAKAYQLVRKYTLNGKLKLINKILPNKGSLLDVGCGTGMFLSVCKKNGWQVSGIEPDLGARKQAETNTGNAIESNILGSYKEKMFDVITLWHVLEHIHRLEETIEWLSEKLANNGKLIIAVPNHESYDANYFKEYWAAYDVPRHLYHFDKQSINNLFDKHGFKVEKIKGMFFDSFYVGMLSTKYKSGKTNYFKAIWVGIKSNFLGKNQNASSLIYIISKR